jgi:hypothetical protein
MTERYAPIGTIHRSMAFARSLKTNPKELIVWG